MGLGHQINYDETDTEALLQVGDVMTTPKKRSLQKESADMHPRLARARSSAPSLLDFWK